MPISVNDILEMRLNGRCFGQRIMNVFHFQCSVAPSTGTVYNNLESFNLFVWDGPGSLWLTDWLALLPDTYLLSHVDTQIVAPNRSAFFRGTYNEVGSIAADQLQSCNDAWVFTKQSDIPGRRGRGDTHMLLPSNGWQAAGELSTTGQADRTAFMNLIPSNVVVTAGGTYAPVLFHRGFSPNFTRITHTTQQPTLRVMRRRTVGQGI